MQFEQIWWALGFLLIPAGILLYWLEVRWRKRSIKKMGEEQMVKSLLRGYRPQRNRIQFLLMMLALFGLIVALMNPRKLAEGGDQENKGLDLVVALDVSKSMLAQDLSPNRLEKSKLFIQKLMRKLNGHRVALVLFAGKAYLQMPLTADFSAADLYINAAGVDAVPTPGTVVTEALRLGNAAFQSKEKKYKSFLLISDGEDHDQDAVNQARLMAEEGVVIFTVGVGSPDGSTILDPETGQNKVDENGEVVVTKLNEQLLKEIAAASGGGYITLNEVESAADELSAALSKLETRSVLNKNAASYQSYYWWAVLLAFLALMMEFFLGSSRSKQIVQRIFLRQKSATSIKTATLFWLFFLGFSSSILQAQTPSTAQIPPQKLSAAAQQMVAQGNELYKKGDAAGAEVLYRKALELHPENSLIQYNLGASLHRQAKFQEAAQYFEQSRTNPDQQKRLPDAYYNEGVAQAKEQKLDEAIEAFKQTLRIDPRDQLARENLQKALQMKKQQQQQQQEQKKQEEKKKEQEEKKQEEQKKDQKQDQPQKKMSEKEVEQKLKSIEEKEQMLRDKLQKQKKSGTAKPGKDW